MESIKRRGQNLFLGSRRKQVTCQLVRQELVERQVAVKCANDPISPGPHVTVPIDLVSVRIAIAGHIQPVARQAFSNAFGTKQAIDKPFVGSFVAIVQERIDLFERRRYTGQVERDSSYDPLSPSFQRRRQAMSFEVDQDKIVNLVSKPRIILHRRDLGTRGCKK